MIEWSRPKLREFIDAIELSTQKEDYQFIKKVLKDCSDRERSGWIYQAVLYSRDHPKEAITRFVELLLEMGPYVEAPNVSIPLINYAVLRENESLLKVCLKLGMDPNSATAFDGQTLLYACVEVSKHPDSEVINERMVKMLLDAGADPYKKSHQGLSALEPAEKHHQKIHAFMRAFVDQRELDEKLAHPKPMDSAPLSSNPHHGPRL